ncbi:MAG: hypothetical protein LCH53_06075 [Bacteroidetes bacterium]|nr:hypothetical protein [Bacteroidota bacterium]
MRFEEFVQPAPPAAGPHRTERHLRIQIAAALRSEPVRAWLTRTVLALVPRLLRAFVNVRPIVDKATEELAAWMQPEGKDADIAPAGGVA